MKKLMVWLAVVPALLLSGCSSAPAEPVSLTSLAWEELSETPEYKNWLATENCFLGDVDKILNLEFLPIRQSDSASASPTPREVLVTRTARLNTSLASEASRLKMLSEASTWDDYSSEDELRRIWMTPSEVKASIDNWVTDRFDLSIRQVDRNTFSTPVRENMKKDWDTKCEIDSRLADVRTSVEEYVVALEALVERVVADFEKKGYTNYFNHTLIKRIGPKVLDGEKVLAFSVLQHRYCDTGYTKRVFGFNFYAPGVKADADGIMAPDLRGDAQETDNDGAVLGLREFVFETYVLEGIDLKKNDFVNVVVTGTLCL